MNGAAWVFLTALVIALFLLAIAVGANSDIASELRKMRRENAQLRRRSLRVLGTPSDLAGLYGSSCECTHQVREHGDLGCAGDPACCCSRDQLMAALDARAVEIASVPAGGAA